MSRAPRWYTLSMKSYLLAVLVLACFAVLQVKVQRDSDASIQGRPLVYRVCVEGRENRFGNLSFKDPEGHELEWTIGRIAKSWDLTWETLPEGRSIVCYFNARNLGWNALIGLGIAAFAAGLLEWQLRRRRSGLRSYRGLSGTDLRHEYEIMTRDVFGFQIKLPSEKWDGVPGG